MSQNRSMASTGDVLATTSAFSDFIVRREFVRDARRTSTTSFSMALPAGTSMRDPFGEAFALSLLAYVAGSTKGFRM